MTLEEDLVRLERQVLGLRSISTFEDRVAELRRMLARESPEIRQYVLRLVAPSLGADLAAAAAAAWNQGVRSGYDGVDERVRGIPATPPRGIIAAAEATSRFVAASLATARKLARAGSDPETVLAPVFAARNAIQRDVVTIVNRAGNAGVTAVADAAGLPTVWVAETNACVECLAYSGRAARPGRMFPGGLTYGAKSYNPEPIDAPPRHPNCRCTVEPLRSAEYASALRREADRSVLRGFSLESESMRVRVDAARRLLANGVDAPKSVQAYARRAVNAGEFPTRGRP